MTDEKTACVDFDKVVHAYEGWTGPEAKGDPIPGARAALRRLQDAGYRVVIYSTRPAEPIEDWLAEHGMDDVVDEVVDGKPFYEVLFDDRARYVQGNHSHALQLAVDAFLEDG